ncbi:isoprenylcysteine carboxylmethyltransferase family protein [uncultured Aquabacterium sp.]|uniref:methyltransferase family protein n=1 Tax=Aquabacterium sp. TaxID=1872578 RepID=UPI0025F0CB10|nr:isoprenylcysteine carboxylmethyltransferase family protein [uncultured Aquabacterium sp.]
MDPLRPLIFVWPEGLLIWAVMAWALWMEWRQLQRKKAFSGGHDGDDRYSGLVISIGASMLQVAAVLAAWHAPTALQDDGRLWAYHGGVAVIVAGMLLRMHCWAALGRFFTHTVTVQSDHQVVDVGAYRYLRHPSYLGALMTLGGFGLMLGNLASLAVMLVGSWAIYLYRIHVEEAALEAALGDAYRRFKQTRKRLIPFVY